MRYAFQEKTLQASRVNRVDVSSSPEHDPLQASEKDSESTENSAGKTRSPLGKLSEKDLESRSSSVTKTPVLYKDRRQNLSKPTVSRTDCPSMVDADADAKNLQDHFFPEVRT